MQSFVRFTRAKTFSALNAIIASKALIMTSLHAFNPLLLSSSCHPHFLRENSAERWRFLLVFFPSFAFEKKSHNHCYSSIYQTYNKINHYDEFHRSLLLWEERIQTQPETNKQQMKFSSQWKCLMIFLLFFFLRRTFWEGIEKIQRREKRIF